MNSNELPFSNHSGAYLGRPLGALEEFIWLLDQNRPAHFPMAAEVSGSTTLSDWCRALDFVQAHHPLFSVRIARHKEDRLCFYQERTASISFRVVQGTNATERWESEAEPVDRLPLMSSVEDILGVTSTDISYPRSGPTSSPERPAVFVTKEDTRPRIKGLSLTTQLTSRLRQRARQVIIEPCEATTFWEIARSATARLGKGQTLEAIKATRGQGHVPTF